MDVLHEELLDKETVSETPREVEEFSQMEVEKSYEVDYSSPLLSISFSPPTLYNAFLNS